MYDEDVMDSEIREALTKLYTHQNEEVLGDNLDGQHTTGPSPTDETYEGNTLPLCFEAFEIIRGGF